MEKHHFLLERCVEVVRLRGQSAPVVNQSTYDVFQIDNVTCKGNESLGEVKFRQESQIVEPFFEFGVVDLQHHLEDSAVLF